MPARSVMIIESAPGGRAERGLCVREECPVDPPGSPPLRGVLERSILPQNRQAMSVSRTVAPQVGQRILIPSP